MAEQLKNNLHFKQVKLKNQSNIHESKQTMNTPMISCVIRMDSNMITRQPRENLSLRKEDTQTVIR